MNPRYIACGITSVILVALLAVAVTYVNTNYGVSGALILIVGLLLSVLITWLLYDETNLFKYKDE